MTGICALFKYCYTLVAAKPQLSTSSSSSSGLSLLNMQSASCSPPCAGSGVCSAQGACTCPTGFNGTSCETCSSGFFGPTCQACPTGCTKCDDGITGSGRCLVPTVTNPPSSCNCMNGECGVNGQCTCLPGWTSASNGTACVKCATGFFQDSTGNCQGTFFTLFVTHLFLVDGGFSFSLSTWLLSESMR